jgi:hypothetical protein
MNPAKFLRHLFSTLVLLFICSGYTYCQDLIYRKDKTVLNVRIRKFDNKTIIYQVPADSVQFNYFMSSLLADSLKYSDGLRVNLTTVTETPYQISKKVPRNYFDFDLMSLSWGNYYINYERLFADGRNSFNAGFFSNRGRKNDFWRIEKTMLQYFNFEPYSYFATVGFNHFPYNKSLSGGGLFRISAGLSMNIGSYRTGYGIYDTQKGYYIYKEDYTAAFSIIANTKVRLYVVNNIQIYAGADASVLPFLTFFCPKFGVSAGF